MKEIHQKVKKKKKGTFRRSDIEGKKERLSREKQYSLFKIELFEIGKQQNNDDH